MDGVEAVEQVEAMEEVEANGRSEGKEGMESEGVNPEQIKRKVATMPKRPYPRYQRRHDVILPTILEKPFSTQKEIAEATAYSPSQVSRIMSSPDFIERYEVIFRDLAFDARSTWLARLREASAKEEG